MFIIIAYVSGHAYKKACKKSSRIRFLEFHLKIFIFTL